MKVTKHQHVNYRAPLLPVTVSAIVRCVHRDGSVTIEARFVLDEQGRATGGYIGHRYRVDPKILEPASSMRAEIIPLARRSA